jgi:type IV pilus assembly protein PilV
MNMCKFKHAPLQSRYRNQGFSMIEVLVSIIIFAFGMLGVAGLQVNSLRGSQNAAYTSAASKLANDYGEYIKGVGHGAESADNNVFLFDSNTALTSVTEDCIGTAKDCGPEALFQALRQEWLARAKDELPNGRIKVCREDTSIRNTSAPYKDYFKWDCSNTGSQLVIKFGWEGKNSKTDALGFGVTYPRLVMALPGNYNF